MLDNTEIQIILRDYWDQQHAPKMENLKEMEKFLENYNLPKLNQEEIENMNRPVTRTEIETIIKNLPTNKWPDGFTSEFYQKFRDEHRETYQEKVSEHRNGLDLTKEENIKKRWQEYTEELYKKDIHDPDNHEGVITHLESDILECEHHYEQS